MKGLALRNLTRGRVANWAIESPSPGVVFISVAVTGPRTLTPLHWRAGDWTKPPVDIEVNPDDGFIQSIQVVLQDERVGMRAPIEGHTPALGLPLVVVADWPTDRYWDEHCPVAMARATTGELIVDLGEREAVSYVGLPRSLLYGWDVARELCRLVIGPLSSEAWDDVNAFSADLGSTRESDLDQ